MLMSRLFQSAGAACVNALSPALFFGAFKRWCSDAYVTHYISNGVDDSHFLAGSSRACP